MVVSSYSQPIPLIFEPGLYRDITAKQAANKFVDGNYIRFISGRVGSIGGWSRQLMQGTILGVVRAHLWWKSLSGVEYGIAGSHKGLYIIAGGDKYYDITPIRQTNVLNNVISTTDTSDIVLITDPVNGAQPGDYISIPSSVTYNNITLLGLYEVLTTPSSNMYTIQASTNANATGTGGGAITIQYYLQTGYADDGTSPGGYGTGPYGMEAWGTPRSAGAPVKARVWCLQNFGEDILAVPTRSGPLYFWDTSSGPGTRAQQVMTASDKNDFMIVTSALRQCVLFGTKDISGNYDPLLIRGSVSEDYTDYVPAATNDAWEYRLTNGNYIVGALETTTNDILVWTDTATYRLRLTGDSDVYSLEHLTDGSGLVGPNAMCEVEGIVYWVTESGLRAYNGSVKVVATTMDKYYFDGTFSPQAMNLNQRTKIFIGVNSQFNEFWIWMPTGDNTEISRYMIVDHKDFVYSDGEMSRTSWADRSTRSNPTAFTADEELYAHETGSSADGQPMNPWVQIGDSNLNEGKDVGLTDYVEIDGQYNNPLTLTIFGKDRPQKPYFTSRSKIVNTDTGKTDIHVRARYLSMKIEAPTLNGNFLLGKLHVGILPDGQR